MLKYLLSFTLLASSALGATPTDGTVYDSATGKMLRYLTGVFRVGSSIASPSTTITVDGTGGVVTAQSFVGPLTGNATTASSVPASGVDLSTVTARFTLVGADTDTIRSQFTSSTNTLSASTAALALQDQRIALSTIALSASTVSLVSRLTDVGYDTHTLTVDLAAEVSNRISSDFYTGLSTQNIRNDLTSETSARIGQDTAIGASTKALNDLLDSETLARIAADFNLGASTKTTNIDLASVSLSTEVLSVSTYTLNNNKVNRLGNDTMSGSLTLPDLIATYGVDAGTVAADSSLIGSMVGTTLLVHNTLTSTGTARFGVHEEPVGEFGQTSYSVFNASGSLTMARSESITLSSNGYISGQSSATFNAFFGDGSHLTGITAPADSTKVDKNTPEQVNLSTVTARFILIEESTGNIYATKLSTNTAVPSNLISLSTVTSALLLKVDRDTPEQVNLSTVTSALAGKQAADSDLDDLADGSLTGSKVGSGVPAANIASGSLGSSVVASSVAAITTAGSCGDSATSCRINYGADGRIQSVSSNTISGGTGASLSSTQTFSGANRFTSTVTVGSLVYTTTATLSSLYVNGETVVASSAPSNSTAIKFSNLRARPYRLKFAYTKNTAGHVRMKINDDTGSNYNNMPIYIDTSNNLLSDRELSAAYVSLNGTTQQGDTYKVVAVLDIIPIGNTVWISGVFWGHNTSATFISIKVNTWYDGSSALSSLTLYTDAGGFTGQVWLQETSAVLP